MRYGYTILAAAALAVTGCCNDVKDIDIIPYPDKVEIRHGSFDAAGAGFYCDRDMDEASRSAVAKFAFALEGSTGAASGFTEERTGKGFAFLMDSSLQEEAYSIEISGKEAVIKASSLRGFNYAIQSVKQMLPSCIYIMETDKDADWTLPCAKIHDTPRFAYRGMHLDVARHFFGIETVRKYIDLMEIHKMNTLHWHLTDDQGWRIEIRKYPKLTEIGSTRKSTVIRKDWKSSDHTPHGGYYTQEEIRDIVEYAAAKGIDIIPEIDLPGHMLAALTSYPELGCTKGPYEVWGRWGVSEDVLCAGREKSMLFLEDVLSEVAELFPSEYIHIGGDECPKTRWENCPACQRKIRELGLKDDADYSAEHYLQSYVMQRMEKFLDGKGKKIIGWDEILDGEPGPGATIMSWRGSEGGIKASQMGHDAIMTPNSHFYFDYYQGEDPAKEPFAFGDYIPLHKVYSYEPFTSGMDENARKHILGVQANMWTEYIPTPEQLEYMLLPRMSALSEVQWCRPENKYWERFFNSLCRNMIGIYDILGCNYSNNAFGVHDEIIVDTETNTVKVRLYADGEAEIRYTLDGSEPTSGSSLYTAPVGIDKDCVLKAKAIRPGIESPVYEKSFAAHKALARKMVLNTEPRDRFGAPNTLVNGARGTESYFTGAFASWKGEIMDVTIDMGTDARYSEVTVGAYIYKEHGDIFNPSDISVFTSDDGENWTLAASETYPEEKPRDPDALKEYSVHFPENTARFLRIKASPTMSIPSWHFAKGQQAIMFVDEIYVK